MVKITTPEQNEEKLNEHQKIELENISKEELLKALENKQPKQLKEVALSLKLTKNLSNQIRVYSKIHDKSMTNSIEQIVTKFFENKTLTRDYFTAKNDVNIAIPTEHTIIQKYITGGVNLIVNLEENEENEQTITPLDKQFKIINELPDEFFEIIELKNINNILDEYDPINECYYSNYNVGVNGKYTNKFLNHYGLIILEKNKHPIMENGKLVIDHTLDYELIGIHSYNNEIIEVKLMNTKQCYELATEVNNPMVLEYFNNFIDYEFIENVKNETVDKWVMMEEIQKTKNQLNHLEYKNNELKKENEQLQHVINNLRKQKKIRVSTIDYDKPLLTNKEIKELQDENKYLCEELEYYQNVTSKRLAKLEESTKYMNEITKLMGKLNFDFMKDDD